MAKYLADELELQSVANAIRAKNKSQESLEFPTDFVSAIANLPSGGNIEEDGNGNLTFSTDGDTVGKMPLTVSAGGTYTPPAGKAYSVVEVDLGKPSAKDVNFRDYDGTITNSYTKEEFLALTAMPANPSHDGLTAQGWNWSFADAQAYVAKYGRLEVGQMYITDDGKTRVYIHLEKGRTSPMLGVCPNGTVDVDWGDGTAQDTLTGTSTSEVKWTPNHAYAAPGDYVIKLTVSEGGSMGFYGSSTDGQYSGLLRYASESDKRNNVYMKAIWKIEIGSGLTNIDDYAFIKLINLVNISIPNSVTNIGNYAINYCYALANINIPNSVTSIGNSTFHSCYNLKNITIPNSVTNIGTYQFFNNYNLANIVFPDKITDLQQSLLGSCYNLLFATIPDSVTNIASAVFGGCSSITSVTIPKDVTSIDTYAFQNCGGVAEYHLAPTTPPTLANVNAFKNIAADCIIYVPYSSDHSILEAYKTATNWSTYASYMQEEPV